MASKYIKLFVDRKNSDFFTKPNYKMLTLLSAGLSFSIISTFYALSISHPPTSYNNITDYSSAFLSFINENDYHLHEGNNNPLIDSVESMNPSNFNFKITNPVHRDNLFYNELFQIHSSRSNNNLNRLNK